MFVLSGKSVYKGIAVGSVLVRKKDALQIQQKIIENPEKEIARVNTAIIESKQQLQKLYEKAKKEAGEDSAAIFDIHQMMLEDEDYLNAIMNQIQKERVNAEYAVAKTGEHFSEMFANMDDEYMKARAVDIKDVSERLVKNLSGQKSWERTLMEPVILVAEDLTPSETVQMEKDKILALVTVHGSANSHTAILARMMNIPALVGVPMKLEEIHDGMCAIVDGSKGEIIFEPTKEACEEAEKQMQQEKENEFLLQSLKGKENVTKDGRKIEIYANIGSPCDLSDVLKNDAGGIGLFRSEFLYIGRNDFPTEEEQFQIFKQVLQTMAGRKVIIRTMDIGADKKMDSLEMGKEENPALGYRAIRICLKEPEMFKTQLRALLRAAVFGNLSVMYPMIISTEEVRQIDCLLEEVKKELEEAGIPYKMPEQGIMIETPAAVMISDELAGMVDFFSIGTNDLIQYTLAVDRQNEKLDDFYDPHHKAILKMIKMTVEHAHQAGKWVGICGELAADLTLTETFINMGVDELSVAPSMILKLRKRVREIS